MCSQIPEFHLVETQQIIKKNVVYNVLFSYQVFHLQLQELMYL